MNEMVALAGLKCCAIILVIVVLLMLIVIYALNKQISKMMELHNRELERQKRKYEGLLDEKNSDIRELLAQKHELEDNCKNYKAQRDFLMAGKAQKEEEPKADSEENQTT